MKPIFTKKRVLISLIALTALTGAAAYFHFHDDPAPDLSRYPRPAHDPVAYAQLKSLCEPFKSHYTEYKPVEPSDIDETTSELSLEDLAIRRDPNALRGLRRYLGENKAALDDAEALLRFENHTAPPLFEKGPFELRTDEIPVLRNATILTARKSLINAVEGKFDDAWKGVQLLALASPARHKGADGLLISYLTNLALDGITRRLAIQVAYLDTDAARIAQNQIRLEQLTPQADSLRRSFLGEIHFASAIIRSDHAPAMLGMLGQAQTWENWKESPKLQITSLWLRANILPNATLCAYEARITPFIDHPDTVFPKQKYDSESDGSLFRRNAGGLRIVSSISVVGPMIQKNYIKHKATHRLTRLALALRAYQLFNDGKYPATLEAVTAGFAPENLTDPFDGKPLRYDAKTGKVWSVGPDLKDDGGSVDEEGESKDIVVAPPVLTPAAAK